jgi:hypothetical protein
MTATIPDTVVADYLANPSYGLSILSLVDPMIHGRSLPMREYYSLTYPGLTKQVHFVNPKPTPQGKDSIITAQMRFMTVPKTIAPGHNVSLGVLRTNNPLWIKALDDSREAEIAEGGVASILIAEEMVEATKTQAQRMADKIVGDVSATLNPLIRQQKQQLAAQETELSRLRTMVAKLSGDKTANIAVDPDVDLDAMSSGDALGEAGDAVADPTKLMRPPQDDDNDNVMLEEARRSKAGKRK